MPVTDLRRLYEAEVGELSRIAEEMTRSGEDREAVARAVHARRLAIAVKYKALTDEPLRSRIIQRTVAAYGNPAGPSIAFLRERGRSWDEIIESAARPGRMP